MESTQPSRTALAAATHRAVHQELEDGRTFRDPLAVAIVGADPAGLVSDARANPQRRRMRLFIAARSRFAEETVAAAVGRGVRQLVVLGAGLDTFAYRNRHGADGLQVFEVDHPATQEWKRARLAAAGIAVPASLTFVPVDFETQSLPEGLAGTGFDHSRRASFSWLGVVPYLSREAVSATLQFVATVPGAEIVFDYSNPPEELTAEQRAAHDARAALVAQAGEPWITYFDTEDLHAELRDLGLEDITDLGPTQLISRYFGGPADAPNRPGGHLIRASRRRPG